MKVWIKALLMTIIILAVIKMSFYAVTGLWIVGYSMESSSMAPNIHVNDIILVQSSQRTNITTYEDGKILNYRSFNDYGDVIVYFRGGNSRSVPILHRTMYWVDEDEPMWNDGPPAPHAGYITKGDNNRDFDQAASINRLQPVREEWIIAVAKGRIPLLGCFYSGSVGSVLLLGVLYIINFRYLSRRKKPVPISALPAS